MVDAMTIQPISAGVALSDSANSGSTGVFDSVELKMASPPMSAMRMKKEGWAGFKLETSLLKNPDLPCELYE